MSLFAKPKPKMSEPQSDEASDCSNSKRFYLSQNISNRKHSTRNTLMFIPTVTEQSIIFKKLPKMEKQYIKMKTDSVLLLQLS